MNNSTTGSTGNGATSSSGLGDDDAVSSSGSTAATMTVFANDGVMESISEIMYPAIRLVGAGLVVWLSSVGSRYVFVFCFKFSVLF